MGKRNKGVPKRAFKKDPVATKIATGVKKKTKTKPVTIDRKRTQFHLRKQTEALNAQLSQAMTAKAERPGAAKQKAKKLLKSETKKTKPQSEVEEEEPDVDMAADELAKLDSAL